MKNKTRCLWASADDALYQTYHDDEWGVPCHDDQRHFEFLLLEAAQAGLSWITILRKREAYRQAFAQFNPEAVARFGDAEIAALLANSGIVRNRLKIASAVSNARPFLAIQEQFGSFDAYVWQFVDGSPIQNQWRSHGEVPCQSPISQALSKDLIKRGFRFAGPTIMYSYMQALGLVNDHTIDCFRHRELFR